MTMATSTEYGETLLKGEGRDPQLGGRQPDPARRGPRGEGPPPARPHRGPGRGAARALGHGQDHASSASWPASTRRTPAAC